MWRTCGSFTLSRPTDSINSEIRTKRARMSAGSSASSASTISFKVSTVHAMEAHHTRYGIGWRSGQAARLNASICRSHTPRRFQLGKIRLTTLSPSDQSLDLKPAKNIVAVARERHSR